jgi:hypothetical protein
VRAAAVEKAHITSSTMVDRLFVESEASTMEGLIFLSIRTLRVTIAEASPIRAPTQPRTARNIQRGWRLKGCDILTRITARAANPFSIAAPLVVLLKEESLISVYCESLIMKIRSAKRNDTVTMPIAGKTNRRDLRLFVESIALSYRAVKLSK